METYGTLKATQPEVLSKHLPVEWNFRMDSRKIERARRKKKKVNSISSRESEFVFILVLYMHVYIASRHYMPSTPGCWLRK